MYIFLYLSCAINISNYIAHVPKFTNIATCALEWFLHFIETIVDKYNGGPVGLSTIATSLSENSETIEEVYEPFLIQQGFIIRTPRGRQVTEKGYNHLGRNKNNQNNLFN